MVLELLTIKVRSCLKTPIERDIIGAIKGANIMAPIITGAELPKSPNVAIRVANSISTRYTLEVIELDLKLENRSLNSSVVA